MGTLVYGNPGHTVDFDDRALQHLQIVITAKLRRRESFIFSWLEPDGDGGGRGSIWLDPTSVILYRFSDHDIPVLNREWIDLLTASADSGSGLTFSPEPFGAEPRPSDLPPITDSLAT